MKLTLEGLKDRAAWEAAGIKLPDYDVAAVAERTKKAPVWVHFGIGNIFRIFAGGIADSLISQGLMDRGITCVETFDFDVVDKIYDKYDNLVLSVTLNFDGSTDKQVLGSLTEAIRGKSDDPKAWARLKEIFTDPGLQMVSFTITEKGYALRGSDGQLFDFIKKDMENGPDRGVGAMAVVTAMLYARFRAGGYPLTLCSMDNVSQNGQKLQKAVLEMAGAWKERGFVDGDFIAYLSDEKRVSFPWSMIDKITPRPSESVAEMLTKLGVEEMEPVITSKRTYIAGYVNAEKPQYLVIEDSFPNGRPPLEKAGVYMTDRDTVNKSERMKVTICLNPLHQAMAPYGCMLEIPWVSDMIADPDIYELISRIGRVEGMDVVVDPGIISPQAFIDECIDNRFANPYLPDTPQRLVVDESQMLSIRFGENIRAYMEKYGDATKLRAIPMAIAGWLRYMLAVNDRGEQFELSPDPMAEEMREALSGIRFGDPDSVKDQLRPILSNEHLLGVDLYRAGIGEYTEEIFKELIAGPGAVRRTLHRYLFEI